MIADWLTSSGMGQLKPVLSALLLPPTPLLLLALAGAGLVRGRPRTARVLVVLACIGVWLCSCVVAARWVESTSRDTHENAVNTLALLRPAGIREIVLVTHATHMPRALREFRAAAAADSASAPMRVTPATMGQAWPGDSTLLRWLPSSEGVMRMRAALHEVLATLGDRR